MMSYGWIIQHFHKGFFPEYILDKNQKFSNINDIVKNIKKFEKNKELFQKTSLDNQKKAQKYTNWEFEKKLLRIVKNIEY